MDQELQLLYRLHLTEGGLQTYMRYFLACQRASIEPQCFAGKVFSGAGGKVFSVECPHCVLGQIERLYPEQIVYDNVLKMFLQYRLTANGTYLLEMANVELVWLPGLFYALAPRREPYERSYPSGAVDRLGRMVTVRYTPQVPVVADIRGHGELCWGGDPAKTDKELIEEGNTYGYTQFPETCEAGLDKPFPIKATMCTAGVGSLLWGGYYATTIPLILILSIFVPITPQTEPSPSATNSDTKHRTSANLLS